MGELYRYPNGLTWPDEDGIFPPQVRGDSALLVYRRFGHLPRAVPPLEHPEPETVEVHGVGHAPLLVADLPDLRSASLHHDGILVRLVGQAVDEPPRLARLRRCGERHRAHGCPVRVRWRY